MSVTKLNRKQLAEQLRHNDTAKIRVAINRGSLRETKNGFIDIKDVENRKWIESQIKLARQRGVVVDLKLDPEPPDMELDESRDQPTFSIGFGNQIDNELKKARTALVKEQIKTAQLNREIALGNYLKTSDMIEAVKIYLDQTMNIANTNLSNRATNICIRHSIKSPEEIVKIKSELTDALNLALDDGRTEVMKCIERMVVEQIDKLAKK
jgi:hypothetical protein